MIASDDGTRLYLAMPDGSSTGAFRSWTATYCCSKPQTWLGNCHNWLCDEYGMLVFNDFWLSTAGYNLEVNDDDLFLKNADDNTMCHL